VLYSEKLKLFSFVTSLKFSFVCHKSFSIAAAVRSAETPVEMRLECARTGGKNKGGAGEFFCHPRGGPGDQRHPICRGAGRATGSCDSERPLSFPGRPRSRERSRRQRSGRGARGGRERQAQIQTSSVQGRTPLRLVGILQRHPCINGKMAGFCWSP
jgi:hypothetical protein